VFVNTITVEPFQLSSWSFYGSKIWSKAYICAKMAAFRCTATRGDDLTSLVEHTSLYRNILTMANSWRKQYVTEIWCIMTLVIAG